MAGVVVLLAAAVGVAQVLPSIKLLILGRASEDNYPRKIRLTNLSANGVTLSWVTNRAVTGAVVYAAGGINQIAYYDQPTSAHHVAVEHLQPEKNYSFTVISGTGSYNFGGAPLTYKTPAVPAHTPTAPSVTVAGTVVDKNGEKIKEALVYLVLANSTPISTMTNDKGNFILTVQNLLDEKTNQPLELKLPQTAEMLFVTNTMDKKTSVYLTGPVILPNVVMKDGETPVVAKPVGVAVSEPTPLSLWEKISLFIESLIKP